MRMPDGREAAWTAGLHEHGSESTSRDPSGRFSTLVEDASEIVTLLDRHGGIVYMNAVGRKMLATGVLTPGEPFLELIHPEDRDETGRLLARLVNESDTTQQFELRIRTAEDSYRHLATTAQNLLDDVGIGAVVLHSRDVTELRQTQATLEQERSYDPLTRLPNRSHFAEHVSRAMSRARRVPGRVAVYSVDIDRFHEVNERHGVATGDEVLCRVSDRLRQCLRGYDTVSRGDPVVARVASDEFLVLCEDVLDVRSAETIAVRLGAAVADTPVHAGHDDLWITATVGVALSGDVGTTAESLVGQASAALHLGKRRGGARVQFLDERPRHTADLEARQLKELREAISTGQLRLLYQPKIEISSGEMVGVEALVRWEHPEQGLVSPLEFIPLAEKSGLIDDLGRWVLVEACRQRRDWEGTLSGPARLVMSVNVSTKQFNTSFPELVRAVLGEIRAPGEWLCIEITESAVMSDVDEAIITIHGLRALGVRVSIDDFGTGFSSLAQLKRLPLDELKIDKSFIDGLGHDREDTAIVAAIVAMAQALELAVVAEGVETVEQLAALRTLGCELAQGFLFSRPLSHHRLHDVLTGAEQLGTVPGPGPTTEVGREPDLVLVVDDSPDVRRFARVSLAASGFEVREAAEGDEAIAMARRLRPTCVVLDVVMPGVSGFEVCRRLRADPLTADCTVVMLTANASADDKVEAFSAGADDYMVKPFAPRDIAGRVRDAINRRRDGDGGSEQAPI
jgi:diguanylate cyclase (GGDEF)-like protein/PAS domain S-box-containing protein